MSNPTYHLVETGLGVQFTEGGDDQGLGGSLGFQVWPVGRHRLGVWQWAHLKKGGELELSTVVGITAGVCQEIGVRA